MVNAELQLISFGLVMQIFVLINPLSSFPFLMEAYAEKLNVRRVALSAIVTAFVLAVVIALFGAALFNVFSITVDSFRIAGGIVLLLLGLDTIRAKGQKEVSVTGVNSMISIIATPMLTGPATISFITILSVEMSRIALLINIAAAFVLVGVVFILFSYLIPKVNATVIDILSRIMGLFLTAVAIQMIAKGISVLLLNRPA